MKLTDKEIRAIASYLGEIAIEKFEQGKPKEEKRIFALIKKLESELCKGEDTI